MKKIQIGLTASAIAFALIGAFAFKTPKELLSDGYQGTPCVQVTTCGAGSFTCKFNGQTAFTTSSCITAAKQNNP